MFWFSIYGIITLVLLIVTYFITDPFKVIYKYDSYSNCYVKPNKDVISTKSYLRNSSKYEYDSFIFGSSRTLAFKHNSWKKYIGDDAKTFTFDASGESIYGIYTKLKYLDSMNVDLKNVLILLCRDCAFSYEGNHEGHLFIKHPVTSGDNTLLFHIEFFKAYINPAFLFSFYFYNYSKIVYPFMTKYLDERKVIYDSISNETTIIDLDLELYEDVETYYSKRSDVFYERGKTKRTDPSKNCNDRHIFMLSEIQKILTERNTTYKIIISPLYDQIKFNQEDYNELKNIFGKNLYDFSGINDFTESKYNYYEASHYRSNVGDSILKVVYSE